MFGIEAEREKIKGTAFTKNLDIGSNRETISEGYY